MGRSNANTSVFTSLSQEFCLVYTWVQVWEAVPSFFELLSASLAFEQLINCLRVLAFLILIMYNVISRLGNEDDDEEECEVQYQGVSIEEPEDTIMK